MRAKSADAGCASLPSPPVRHRTIPHSVSRTPRACPSIARGETPGNPPHPPYRPERADVPAPFSSCLGTYPIHLPAQAPRAPFQGANLCRRPTQGFTLGYPRRPRWGLAMLHGKRQRFSRIPNSASRIPHPASRIPHPASRIPNPASRIPNPASRIPRPESRVPNPASRIPPGERAWASLAIALGFGLFQHEAGALVSGA